MTTGTTAQVLKRHMDAVIKVSAFFKRAHLVYEFAWSLACGGCLGIFTQLL